MSENTGRIERVMRRLQNVSGVAIDAGKTAVSVGGDVFSPLQLFFSNSEARRHFLHKRILVQARRKEETGNLDRLIARAKETNEYNKLERRALFDALIFTLYTEVVPLYAVNTMIKDKEKVAEEISHRANNSLDTWNNFRPDHICDLAKLGQLIGRIPPMFAAMTGSIDVVSAFVASESIVLLTDFASKFIRFRTIRKMRSNN
jgi:hypothetical protein